MWLMPIILRKIHTNIAYCLQEKEKTDLVEDFFNNISVQLNMSMLSRDSVMLIGDLDAKLGKDIIKGDIHDMSTNGEHLMSITEKYNLTVVNSLDICRGLFTGVNNKNTMEKSILDYVLVSNDLVSWIVGLQIDEGKLFTAWWKLKRDKRFSDHNAMLLSITATKSSMPVMYKGKLVWNFNDKSGWDKFQELTTNDQTFSNIWASSDDVEASYKQWSYKLESVINQCFKKAELGYVKSSIIKKYDL